MTIELKGGFQTEDPRLDALPQFDERSRDYPVATAVPADVKGRTWWNRTWLDQGVEGACVGFAWSHELSASPKPHHKLTNAFAREIYHEAQKIDEWPGESYEGTSVLAGAKIIKTRGFMDEYRWAFTIDEVLRAISHEGPVVLGLPWLDGMFQTRPSGLLDVSGPQVGRHAIMARGLSLKPNLKGESNVGPVVRLHNSWGKSWGVAGAGFVKVDDLERLLKDQGECCVPIGRRR